MDFVQQFMEFATTWGLGVVCLVAAVVYLIYRNKCQRDELSELREENRRLHEEKTLLAAVRNQDG